jgi:tetratricopeptide (TPR) repeat protein
VIFRRSPLAELEGAHRALAEGRYEAAFALLETAAKRPRARAAQAQYWLHLAAVYALYGVDGLENGGPALKAAVTADPNLASDPLYQTLFWEFAAYRGGAVSDVKRGLRLVAVEAQPLAAYHACAALLAVGAAKSALRRLETLESDDLPAYLVWRRWSLLGQAHEALSDWDAAAAAYAEAVERAQGPERSVERLSLATCLLELGRSDEVLGVIDAVDRDSLAPEDVATLYYVEGRAHLDAGNPNLALERFALARSHDPDGDDDFSLDYATGQALTAVGRYRDAVAVLRRAIAVAPADNRAYAQHEAAYALSESDELAEADALLGDVLSDPAYPHRAEAVADLADVRFKLGEFEAAEALAEQALDMGATASACLVLGHLAYEYYRLDEAVAWFEQTIGASAHGDSLWLSAHQVLADVFAQRGERFAERVLHHAQAALGHTDVGSEWRLPLERHAEWARSILGGHDRLLN